MTSLTALGKPSYRTSPATLAKWDAPRRDRLTHQRLDAGVAQELEELLFLAYWPAHDPPEETSERQYRQQTETLAVALLHGDTQGLIWELRQHSDNFSLAEQMPGTGDGHGRQRLPQLHLAAPGRRRHARLLTAAVAGQNPGLSATAVREHARCILNDPSRKTARSALFTASTDA